MIYTRNDHSNDTEVILGDIFFENYYVIWDFDQKKIGFNGYFGKDSPKPEPKKPSKKHLPTWATVLIILSVLGILGGAVYLFLKYKRKHVNEKFFLSNEIYDYKPIN
jgi:hypothetical protein